MKYKIGDEVKAKATGLKCIINKFETNIRKEDVVVLISDEGTLKLERDYFEKAFTLIEKKYKYYFKILNDELFGGKGSEGYMSLSVKDKYDNPLEVARNKFYITKYSEDVEIMEISEEEYIKATEE